MVLGILQEITPDEVEEIKDLVFNLYKQELYAQQLYLGQIRKLEGSIVSILKELSVQEEIHAQTLKILLGKINFETKDTYDKVPQSKINEPLFNAVKIDIDIEKNATKMYNEAINASTSIEMRTLLTQILNQEMQHINILKKYFDENKALFE